MSQAGMSQAGKGPGATRIAGYLSGLGVLGPGFADWPSAAAILRRERIHTPEPTVLPAPALLPAAERRRSGRVVKLALAVAAQACTLAGKDPAELPSVFTSSGADGHNCHELCEALARPLREISPTRFSNSVHNAAAGYWSIGTGAQRESTVLCAHDASFAAGLLEALVQVSVHQTALLLVAYDADYPPPMHAKRPVPDAFGTGWVFTPRREPGSLARIEIALEQRPADTLPDPALESLRTQIPAARCLPLLGMLARREAGSAAIEYLDCESAVVGIEPCR